MRKAAYILIFFYLIPLSISVGQSQTMIRTTIPKTSISLIPPANFVNGDFFDGFLHKPTSSSITGKIESGKGYVEFNQRFTPDYLKAIGLTFIKKEEIKTADLTGTLYLLSYVVQNTNMHRYMLVTGDTQNTYFVMANYPVGYKSKISEPIKRSLMTVRYK
jgi:hypothetical protein